MADETLGEAKVKTEVDLDGLDKGIAEAEKKATEGFGKVGDVIKGALAVGVAAGFATLGAAFDVASDAAKNTATLKAQLGLTTEEAERLGDVSLQVFGDNWTGSVEEAGAIVGGLQQQLGALSDESLRTLAGGVAAISDNFGEEAPKIINAVKAIRDNFPGTTEQQALDMIAAGFQRGLNSSGDFLDSIGEYSVQFGESGSTAGEFFSVMETGLQSGMLGTDKIADAFKESRIRITELSDDVIGAFESIGGGFADSIATPFDRLGDNTAFADEVIGALESIGLEGESMRADLESGAISVEAAFRDSMYEGIRSGAISTAQAQTILLDGLREMDNAVYQNSAGVAIFGTQWEDLGSQALLAVDPMNTSIEDLAGTTDSLNAKYTNLQDVGTALWRMTLVELAPLGDALLTLANDQMPRVQETFTWLKDNIPPVFATVQENAIPILLGLGVVLAGLAPLIYASVIPPFIAWATTAGAAAVSTALAMAPVVIPIVAIGVAVALLAKAWQSDWGGMRTNLTAFWEQSVKPAFEQLKTWLTVTIPNGVKVVIDWWGDLVEKGEELGSSISTALAPAFEGIASTLSGVVKWFSDISAAISGVVDWITKLIDKLAAVEIPDWLQGHSPPPLADWFGYIADEAGNVTDALPSFEGMGISSGAMAGAMPSPAGMSASLSLNSDGLGWLRNLIRVEATSVVDDKVGRARNRNLT